MDLVINLDEEWAYEESISEAIKEAIETAIGREIRKLAKVAIEENRSAIIAVANAYAKRAISQAQEAIK